MADPRFFTVAGPFTLRELAEITGSELVPGAEPLLKFEDVAPLDTAGVKDVSFLENRKYVDAFSATSAGACFVHPDFVNRAPAHTALLLSKSPYKAYALAAKAFYPEPRPAGGVSAHAVIDPSATIGRDTTVDPGAVIGKQVTLGQRCKVGSNAVIADGVVVGDDTTVGASASLSHCIVGSRVIIYPGARIGQDGFGFAMDAAGHVRVPQLGRVIIEDDVEVGANATIDRGAGPDTVIGRGSMIDNLVQIGHNVRLGSGCVIVAQAGISGSTKLDHHVVVAAQAGLTGHLRIGPGAQIGAQAGVMKDVGPGVRVVGSPAVPVRQFFRQVATLARLAKGEND